MRDGAGHERAKVFSAGIAVLAWIAACGEPAGARGPLVRRAKSEGASSAASEDDAGFEANGGRGDYWSGVRRSFAHSPSGNAVGVSCHNCYEATLASSAENLAATLGKLHAAQAQSADLLELDLKEQAGTWYVGHDDDGSTNGARFEDVLGDAALEAGDQLLYLELKEQTPDTAHIGQLLDSIAAAGYAVDGRPVIVRSFNARFDNLRIANQLLAEGAPADHAAYFRTQVLYTLAEAADAGALESTIDTARAAGIAGVEFNYTSPSVAELLGFARDHALGTNVWTFGMDDGTERCAEFRDASDAVTTDSDLAACRAAIEGR